MKNPLPYIRAYHGLSISELSNWLNVSERTLRRWESGELEAPAAIMGELRELESLRDDLYDELQEHPSRATGHTAPQGLVRVVLGEIALDTD